MTLDQWVRFGQRVPVGASLRGLVGAVVLGAVASLVGACGGSSPSAAPPGPAGLPDTEATDDEAELTRGEYLLGLSSAKVQTTNDGAPGLEPQPGTAPQIGATPNAGPPTCETACSALASMVRAAGRICSLSGPGDRCSRAQSRVDRARTHVESTCGSCS